MAAAFAQTDHYELAGCLSPIHWIRLNCHMTSGAAADQAAAVQARSRELKAGEGGMVWIRGVLDPEGGAVVLTALEPLARRNGKDDDRRHDHRLADGLVEMAQHTLDGASLPRRGGPRPHLPATKSLEALLQRCGAPAAELQFSLPLSPNTADRPARG